MEADDNIFKRKSVTLKRINYLYNEIDSVYHDMSVKLGLSDSAMIILYTICDNGGDCMLQEIIRWTGMSKQTINSAVRKLEAEGYIRLSLIGGKNKCAAFTDKGYELAKKTVLRIMEAEDDIYASWSEEDRDKYIRLTEKYLVELKEKSDKL